MSVSRTTFLGLGLALFAGALWLYWPSLQGEFLRVDDVEYLRKSIQCNGLSWSAVKWAFTSTASYYHPLTRLSHVLDYQIWGTNAAGHHATSVVLHALNAVLLFGFLWTLLGEASLTMPERLMIGWGVAAVFAVHPLQNESVAWMSGRTQVLCTTFLLGGLWAYVAGTHRWTVWVLYIAALLSKPMAVSMPFLMLAIDYFPLRRHQRSGWRRPVCEKTGMIVLAAAVGVAAIVTRSQGSITSLLLPASVQVFRMFESLAFFLWKLVWPTHLSPTYPIPWGLSLRQLPVLASVLSIVLITAAAVLQRRRLPMLAAAWGAYVALVLPASGLMSQATQMLAQRYAYLAMVPLLLLAGGAVVWLLRRSSRSVSFILICFLSVQLWVFAMRTRGLIPDWHSDEAMWRATWAEFPDSAVANLWLATELLDEGRAEEALPYAQRAVDIGPEIWDTHVRLGLALNSLGRPQEAIEQQEQALRINPNAAMAMFGIGAALVQLGKPEDAIRHYETALRLDPQLDGAYNNLGIVLLQFGRVQEAIDHFQQAVQIDPAFVEAHNNLGLALVQVGRMQDAIRQYEQAIQIQPDSSEAYYNLGNAYLQLGNPEKAVIEYQQAIRIRPDYADAHNNLGLALAQLGAIQGAIKHYQQALRIKPDFAAAQYNLRSALERTGKLREAVIH
jgi:tetratricopeptide (TPR) repeat protein